MTISLKHSLKHAHVLGYVQLENCKNRVDNQKAHKTLVFLRVLLFPSSFSGKPHLISPISLNTIDIFSHFCIYYCVEFSFYWLFFMFSLSTSSLLHFWFILVRILNFWFFVRFPLVLNLKMLFYFFLHLSFINCLEFSL